MTHPYCDKVWQLFVGFERGRRFRARFCRSPSAKLGASAPPWQAVSPRSLCGSEDFPGFHFAALRCKSGDPPPSDPPQNAASCCVEPAFGHFREKKDAAVDPKTELDAARSAAGCYLHTSCVTKAMKFYWSVRCEYESPREKALLSPALPVQASDPRWPRRLLAVFCGTLPDLHCTPSGVLPC